MTRHIPVTILGGYLGAGKTTVINHLLSGDHGVRIAVLVNDFGAVNVDASLIAETADDAIALTNGCVCCSIADDLGAALDAQTARAEPPDHIVIEASGVAEPARIAAYAQGWPGVALDRTVTIVDAETVRDRVADKYVGGVVSRQIEAADVLILNRTDLTDDTKAVRSWLSDRSGSPILESTFGRVDPARLLGPKPESIISHVGTEEPEHGLHTRWWRPGGPVDSNEVAALLAEMPSTIHRVKGHLTDRTSGARLLTQAVGNRLSVTDSTGSNPEGLVLIGTDAAHLEALLKSLNDLS